MLFKASCIHGGVCGGVGKEPQFLIPSHVDFEYISAAGIFLMS